MGCSTCDQGYFLLTQCPQRFIGSELIEGINIVDGCQNGVLPVSGGLLDQPAYYMELSMRLKTETNMIEREQAERRKK